MPRPVSLSGTAVLLFESTRAHEQVFQKPVCCYNYPKAIKAFYMRENDVGTDGRQVASLGVRRTADRKGWGDAA